MEYIQLREKDLSGRALESLAGEAVRTVRENPPPRVRDRELRTVLFINSRTDVALVSGADGVHLRSDDVSPGEVRLIWKSAEISRTQASSLRIPIISVACHSPAQVFQAEADGADLALFAPVFEKKDSPATRAVGLDGLREASRAKIPVLTLGGVTFENAQACIGAGAAGIAAIRLFQEHEIAEVLQKLR